jgi:hypothetical protein
MMLIRGMSIGISAAPVPQQLKEVLDGPTERLDSRRFRLPPGTVDVRFYWNGLRMADQAKHSGAGDYTFVDGAVTLFRDPDPDDTFVFDYLTLL